MVKNICKLLKQKDRPPSVFFIFIIVLKTLTTYGIIKAFSIAIIFYAEKSTNRRICL